MIDGLKYYTRKIKDVSWKDILSCFPLVLAVVLGGLTKKRWRNTWVIAERKNEARDNGFYFFKYITNRHPGFDCVYIINKKCADYSKVKDLGSVVQYGSILHWMYYFYGKCLISPESCKPNAYICTALERSGIFRPYSVFLQHGVTINRAEYLMADKMCVDLFFTAAKPETDFVKANFGYSKEVVHYTGFARFDSLHKSEQNKRIVFVMPTWRKWLRFKSEAREDVREELLTSDYVKHWKSFLNSNEIATLIQAYDLEIVFHMHPNFEGLIDSRELLGDYIHSSDEYNEDIQGIMKSSVALITDYSSVFFDMVYMKKPVIFFQFDESMFRKHHYEKGWFDYGKTAFGKQCYTEREVVIALQELCLKRFSVDAEFLMEHKRTFTIYDNNNSERIFRVIRQSLTKKAQVD